MPLIRRRKPSSNYVRRKKAFRRRRANKGFAMGMAKLGFLKVTRKMQQIQVYNSQTTMGTINISGTWPGAAPVVLGTPTLSTTGLTGYYDVVGSASVSLNQLLNYTEFTTLFDKYKVNWVRMRIYSGGNVASINGKGLLPSLVWSIDEDDAVLTGLTVDQIREKMGSKERQFPQDGRPISIFWKPKVAVAAAFGGSSTSVSGLEVKKAGYVNATYAGLPHYGVKFALRDVNLDTTANGVYTNFRFDITMNVSLRDVQ